MKAAVEAAASAGMQLAPRRLLSHALRTAAGSSTMKMKKRDLTPPLVGAFAATRALLGFGAGMLLGNRIPTSRRRQVAWTMVGVGAISTVPLAVALFRRA
jgi:hypothetical protein